MIIEMGIGWVPDEAGPKGHIRSANPGEYAKEIDRLRNALMAAKIPHQVVDDDCWFSCPLSGECCNDKAPQVCTCGADDHNAKIDAALVPEREWRRGESSSGRHAPRKRATGKPWEVSWLKSMQPAATI